MKKKTYAVPKLALLSVLNNIIKRQTYTKSNFINVKMLRSTLYSGYYLIPKSKPRYKYTLNSMFVIQLLFVGILLASKKKQQQQFIVCPNDSNNCFFFHISKMIKCRKQ